jgi:hypothetical protein
MDVQISFLERAPVNRHAFFIDAEPSIWLDDLARRMVNLQCPLVQMLNVEGKSTESLCKRNFLSQKPCISEFFQNQSSHNKGVTASHNMSR